MNQIGGDSPDNTAGQDGGLGVGQVPESLAVEPHDEMLGIDADDLAGEEVEDDLGLDLGGADQQTIGRDELDEDEDDDDPDYYEDGPHSTDELTGAEA